MRPFDEYYEEFSKTKKKNLQNFIDIARKIHRGEISFNQHKNVKKSNQNFIGVKRQRNDTTNNNNDIVEFYYMRDNEKIYLVPKVKKSTYTYIVSENK